jgi:rare lipoprotein A
MRKIRAAVALAAIVALDAGCVHRAESGPEPRSPPTAFEGTFAPPAARAEVQEGYATWYGASLAGHKTASGERFDPGKLTAAHRTLPLGTWVEVTRVDTGQSVRVRINDRGPFGHEDRIIDLSRAAAEVIGGVKLGVVKVQVRVVDPP